MANVPWASCDPEIRRSQASARPLIPQRVFTLPGPIADIAYHNQAGQPSPMLAAPRQTP